MFGRPSESHQNSKARGQMYSVDATTPLPETSDDRSYYSVILLDVVLSGALWDVSPLGLENDSFLEGRSDA